MDYERITAEDRLGQVQGRLTSLESDHYRMRLDLIVATNTNEQQITQLQENISNTETQIMEMRTEEDAVQAEIDARTARTASSTKVDGNTGDKSTTATAPKS
jgi:uncharacterized protein YlxW (UPF0749 family)